MRNSEMNRFYELLGLADKKGVSMSDSAWLSALGWGTIGNLKIPSNNANAICQIERVAEDYA